MSLEVGKVYEIRHRFLASWNGAPPLEREFLKLIGFSSKNEPVFEVNGGFATRGGNWQDILPLQEKPHD
jgi:hypothetical protein